MTFLNGATEKGAVMYYLTLLAHNEIIHVYHCRS